MKVKKFVIKTDTERFYEFMQGHCPYCKSSNISVVRNVDGKIACTCSDCLAENTFSSPSLRYAGVAKENPVGA